MLPQAPPTNRCSSTRHSGCPGRYAASGLRPADHRRQPGDACGRHFLPCVPGLVSLSESGEPQTGVTVSIAQISSASTARRVPATAVTPTFDVLGARVVKPASPSSTFWSAPRKTSPPATLLQLGSTSSTWEASQPERTVIGNREGLRT
jgi:hypothetical protein